LAISALLLVSGFGCTSAKRGEIITDSLYSDALQETRALTIYLPPGYSRRSGPHYPVLYYLHGRWTPNDGPLRVAGVMDSLVHAGVVPLAILVLPDGSGGPYDNGFWVDSEVNGALEQFFIEDVIPHVDATYRTLANRDHRAVFGHGEGAFGALRVALKHPELFCAVASHSAPADAVPLRGIELAIRRENRPGPPYQFTPSAGRFTGLAFSLAAALSPRPEAQPYPVEFPVDSLGELREEVLAEWKPQFPAALIRPHLSALDSLLLFVDCGMNDQLILMPTNESLRDTLAMFRARFRFESYVGQHQDRLLERLTVSLPFLLEAVQREGD
jgi:enterochelin esterase-like enzyme